jgi:putative membrane protein
LHKIFLGGASVVAILLAITLLLRVPVARSSGRKKSAMNEEPTHKQSTARLDASTQLAYERTYLAHERTLMGWVRTAISLISFGFTIAKVFELLREKHGEEATLLGPRAIGIIMIGTGLVALALATMQHRRALRVMHERCPELPPSLAGVMAAFFALVGILALFSVILRMR